MTKCPNCGSPEGLDDFDTTIVCKDCGYTIFKKTNPSFHCLYKKLFIELCILLAKLIYVLPIVTLYIIIIALIYFIMTEVFIFDNFISLNTGKISEEIINKLIIYFFVMLAVADLSILVLREYVYKYIYNLILDLRSLCPSYYETTDYSYYNLIKHEEIKDKERKLYLEKLLIFGVIIILLETFSKLFSSHNNNQDLKFILLGISMVLISIGIWKYLSLKADLNLKYADIKPDKESEKEDSKK